MQLCANCSLQGCSPQVQGLAFELVFCYRLLGTFHHALNCLVRPELMRAIGKVVVVRKMRTPVVI
jgi:hypothetical protein